jgi:hypothetical protein
LPRHCTGIALAPLLLLAGLGRTAAEEPLPQPPERVAPALRFRLERFLASGEARLASGETEPSPLEIPSGAAALPLVSVPAGETEVDLRIRFHPGMASEALSGLEGSGAVSIQPWPEIGRINARMALSRVLGLAAHPAIQWIEERPAADLDRDENDSMRRAIGLEGLAPLPGLLRGRGVKVGAWEEGHPDVESRTGLFTGHDDLWARVRLMEPSDTTAHATEMAGVVAGDGRSSEAQGGQPYQWRGAAPEAQLLYYSTLDSDVEAAELVRSVNEEHIQLSLHSWGEKIDRTRCEVFGDYTIRAAEFDQAIAGPDPAQAGSLSVPVVFSVGNYQGLLECAIRGGGAVSLFPGFSTINPPHTAKNIIAVGAVYSEDLGMTCFSSWGPTDDGRIKPDLVAPGSRSRGAKCPDGDRGITSTSFNPPDGYDGYRADAGTSHAAACVAGALAVLVGERVERGAPPLPPAAWKAILIESARDLTADPMAVPTTDPVQLQEQLTRFKGPDYFYGYGLIWLPSAYLLSRSPACLIEGRLSGGEERRMDLSVPAGTLSLRVTLAWDDPPGDPAAARALVNDLDLSLVEELQGGFTRIHLPWVLDSQHPDQPAARGVDRLNNVEQVEADIALGARITLVVSGARITRGPQRYWVALGPDCQLAPAPPRFKRGDANGDLAINIADGILLLNHLFLGGQLACDDAADANDDGRIDIADSVRILGYLFLGTAPVGMPPLGGECQSDPTPDRLGCKGPTNCP